MRGDGCRRTVVVAEVPCPRGDCGQAPPTCRQGYCPLRRRRRRSGPGAGRAAGRKRARAELADGASAAGRAPRPLTRPKRSRARSPRPTSRCTVRLRASCVVADSRPAETAAVERHVQNARCALIDRESAGASPVAPARRASGRGWRASRHPSCAVARRLRPGSARRRALAGGRGRLGRGRARRGPRRFDADAPRRRHLRREKPITLVRRTRRSERRARPRARARAPVEAEFRPRRVRQRHRAPSPPSGTPAVRPRRRAEALALESARGPQRSVGKAERERRARPDRGRGGLAAAGVDEVPAGRRRGRRGARAHGARVSSSPSVDTAAPSPHARACLVLGAGGDAGALENASSTEEPTSMNSAAPARTPSLAEERRSEKLSTTRPTTSRRRARKLLACSARPRGGARERGVRSTRPTPSRTCSFRRPDLPHRGPSTRSQLCSRDEVLAAAAGAAVQEATARAAAHSQRHRRRRAPSARS